MITKREIDSKLKQDIQGIDPESKDMLEQLTENYYSNRSFMFNSFWEQWVRDNY